MNQISKVYTVRTISHNIYEAHRGAYVNSLWGEGSCLALGLAFYENTILQGHNASEARTCISVLVVDAPNIFL